MLNKFIEVINVTNIDEKTKRLFFLEGLTSSRSSWLLVTETSIVGRAYPPQCGLQDSGDEKPQVGAWAPTWNLTPAGKDQIRSQNWQL